MQFKLTKGTKRCEQSVESLFVNFEPHSVQHYHVNLVLFVTLSMYISAEISFFCILCFPFLAWLDNQEIPVRGYNSWVLLMKNIIENKKKFKYFIIIVLD